MQCNLINVAWQMRLLATHKLHQDMNDVPDHESRRDREPEEAERVTEGLRGEAGPRLLARAGNPHVHG